VEQTIADFAVVNNKHNNTAARRAQQLYYYNNNIVIPIIIAVVWWSSAVGSRSDRLAARRILDRVIFNHLVSVVVYPSLPSNTVQIPCTRAPPRPPFEGVHNTYVHYKYIIFIPTLRCRP